MSLLRPGKRRRFDDELRALPFLLPWLIGVVLFFGYPLVSTVWFSFTRYDQLNPPVFVGLRNWVYVLTAYPPFVTALKNTLILIALMVPLRMIFGLGLGMLVMRVRQGGGLLRTVFYLPYLAPPVAATIAFVFLLNPGTGPVNRLLGAIGLPQPAWFTDPATAKPALTLLALWGVGDLMIIFLAALLDVPRDLYEAASLDGAGSIARFRYITLPSVQPIIIFSVVTGVIATMQYYTEAIVAGKVASGQSTGPGSGFVPGYPGGSTLTLPQLVYSLGFQNFDTGSASVVAVILMVLALLFTTLLLRRGSAFLAEGE